MRRKRVLVLGILAASAFAVAPARGAEPQDHVQHRAAVEAQPKPDQSPVGSSSLRRIRRRLAETPPTTATTGSSLLKLEYYVHVVGKAPRVDFFKDFNIGPATPVQYGAMTHGEFLRLTAPPWRRTWW